MTIENQYYNSDEITLKELILKILDFGKEIRRKWWVVLFITSISVGYFLFKHYSHIATYNSEVKFIIENGNQSSNISGILGQFGFSGGAQTSGLNPNQAMEVARSNHIMKEVLMKSIGEVSIANHIIETYRLDEKWAESRPEFQNFRFNDSLDLHSNLEKLAFKRVSNLIWKGTGNNGFRLAIIEFDLDGYFFHLNINTIDETLAFYLGDGIYNTIKEFFEETIFEDKIKMINLLNIKKDSLQNLRTNIAFQLGRLKDQNNNVFGSQKDIEIQLLQQDLIGINSMYMATVQNFEVSSLSLQNQKAIFINIDHSFFPLSKNSSLLSKKLVYGFLVGIFLSILIIILRKVYFDIMS